MYSLLRVSLYKNLETDQILYFISSGKVIVYSVMTERKKSSIDPQIKIDHSGYQDPASNTKCSKNAGFLKKCRVDTGSEEWRETVMGFLSTVPHGGKTVFPR